MPTLADGARDGSGELEGRARVRKTVSIVFADVVGSTALGERLDPETLQLVIGRYGGEMQRVVELHGGRVEKFIGDAVMAVFGVPVLHEDDALRAVRAGLGMRDAIVELNRELEADYGVELGIRIGVHTGEVITDELAVDQALVAGDAVNAAARLQAAAPTGAVLIGPETHRLVAGRVRLRRHGDLELRGKTGRMRTWRVEGLVRGRESLRAAPARAMVGRRRELGSLRRRFDRCRRAAPLRGHDGVRPGRHRQVAARRASSWPTSRATRASSSAAACPTARASPTGR